MSQMTARIAVLSASIQTRFVLWDIKNKSLLYGPWAKPGLAQALHGKTFVLTGQLKMLSRDEAKEKIRELGGQVSESVSKKTNYVVVGKEPGTKLDMAKKLGIKIIVEKEFLKLIQS